MFKRFCLSALCILILSACSLAPRFQLTIEEHLLTGAPDISTDQLVYHFAQGNQDSLLSRTKHYKDFNSQAIAYNQRLLEPLGYILKTHPSPEGGKYVDIYHGDQLVARDVVTMRPVSMNASQTDFVDLVDLSKGTYLFTRELFEMRDWFVGRQPWAYVGDRVLSLELTHLSQPVSEVRVSLADQPVYNAQFNNVSTYGAFDGPWSYGDHWALQLLDAQGSAEQGWEPVDRLIQDGQDVNTVKGYDQTFQFTVLDGRPFYFYQKDGKIGISFNGREIAKGYDEIPHYRCCIESLLNPGNSMNMVWFFARRGTDWYYVEAYLPAAP